MQLRIYRYFIILNCYAIKYRTPCQPSLKFELHFLNLKASN